MPDAAAALAFDANMSRGDAVRAMRNLFNAAGLETPGLDARFLAGHALRLDPLALAVSPEQPVGSAVDELAQAARRRLAREPVARIIGAWEFYGLPFELGPSTLVPRPETETVVEAALAGIDRDAPLRLLDLGTGSGAILVALLHVLPRAFGIGVDLSSGAVSIARRNAAANGVTDRAAFLAGNWAEPLGGTFDLVVSNPPYVERAVIASLGGEVRLHDPLAALDGGPDGLDAYRAIAQDLGRLLAPGGRAVVEIGSDQAAAVSCILVDAGFSAPRLKRDLGHRPRALVVR